MQPAGAPQLAVTPPTPGSTASPALNQLFENVNFWSQKGQPQMAMQELAKVLTLAPRDPDALATAARLAYQNGQYDAGNRYRELLRAAAPGDPRLAALSAERPLSAADLQILANARALAVAGKKDEAVRAYRQVFHGGDVPDSLATEYYIALGTSSHDGFVDAIHRLGDVAARWPNDASFKLAYAQLMTYDEASRPDGIDMLEKLTHVPAVAAGARIAWHDALTWQGGDPRTVQQTQLYLKEVGPDADLEAKLKSMQQELPDEGSISRLRGYEADAAGNEAVADAQFSAALQHDPNDVDSMVMLSIIRRREGRTKDSDDLVARALRTAPDRHDEIIKTIGYDPATLGRPQPGHAGQGGDPAAAATIRRQYAHVSYLTDRGEYAQAEAELRRLMGAHPATGNIVQLGYIQLRAGELAAAEASFKRVLASNPRSTVALGGLASVYSRQGRDAEAQAIYTRLGTRPPGQGAGGGARGSTDDQRIQQLRAQAQSTPDMAQRISLFRQAIAIDPSYPWTKLELARLLYAQGQRDEANQMMAGVTAGARPTQDQLQAGLIWAQEHNQAADIDRLVPMLPAARRTPQLVDLQQRSAIRLEVERAQPGGRAALLAIAAQPDPTGARGRAITEALVRMGDKAAAIQAVQAGLAATHPPTAAQRVAYAGGLAQAELYGPARTVLQGTDGAALQPLARQEYSALADSLAAREADSLARQGKNAEAYDVLAARLRANPDSTTLNLAVARLYASAGRPKQANAVAEQTLARTPSDLDAQQVAVDTAIQTGDYARARSIADAAVQSAPDDPRGYLMQADIARARGENGPALAALRKARSLRQQQLSGQ